MYPSLVLGVSLVIHGNPSLWHMLLIQRLNLAFSAPCIGQWMGSSFRFEVAAFEDASDLQNKEPQ
jgi:hypothetical protein